MKVVQVGWKIREQPLLVGECGMMRRVEVAWVGKEGGEVKHWGQVMEGEKKVRETVCPRMHQENSKLLYCYFLCFLCLI